jgi:ribose transport system substrate-binding protein
MSSVKAVRFPLAAVLLLALAACGTSQGSNASGGSSLSSAAAKAAVAKNHEQVQALYNETYSSPPTSGPQPQPGKSVGGIVYGPAPNTETFAAGMQEVGKAFNWKVSIFDGKFSSDTQLSGVRQAIAAHADAIVLYIIDCPSIKSGLEEAKSAGIPVIAAESFDCSELKAGEPSLFTSGLGEYNTEPFGGKAQYDGWVKAYAKAPIAWFIDRMQGNANVIIPRETDSHATLLEDQGAREQLKTCPTCKVAGAFDFTGVDFGSSLQNKASQAILKAPDANAMFGVYDAVVTGGLAAAVKTSGRKLSLSGGEGYPPNVDLTHAGVQSVGSAMSVAWESYAAMDTVNRRFHGQEPAPNGIGLALYDATNGLPPKGEQWTPKFDFKTVYLKTWGLK